MRYKVLNKAIQDRGIRKTVIAARLGIAPATLYRKIAGVNKLAYEEAQTIAHEFFPDIPIDELFKTA